MYRTLLPWLTCLVLGCASLTACESEPETRRVEVTVNASGYEPGRIEVAAGTQLTLAFRRVTDEGCGQELVIASEEL